MSQSNQEPIDPSTMTLEERQVMALEAIASATIHMAEMMEAQYFLMAHSMGLSFESEGEGKEGESQDEEVPNLPHDPVDSAFVIQKQRRLN